MRHIRVMSKRPAQAQIDVILEVISVVSAVVGLVGQIINIANKVDA